VKTASILVADDHPVVRAGVRSLLQAEPGWKVVAEATTGRQALALIKELKPDLAIMDLSMPELNGLAATRLIMKASPRTRVLILTMHAADELIAMTLKAGARGYVLKSEAERDIVDAVRTILQGGTFFTTSAAITKGLAGSGSGGTKPRLTAREVEIIQLLAEGHTNKEVAAALGISTRTAENHRARIMEKLGLQSLSALVRYAIRNKIIEA